MGDIRYLGKFPTMSTTRRSYPAAAPRSNVRHWRTFSPSITIARMPHVDRNKLHFGPYRTPRFKYGAKVECEARGEVTIVRLSNGRLPWPIGKTQRATSMVLYADLARAVRREAACAVMFWWGVGASTVNTWRRAIGVPNRNEGDRRLIVA